LRLTALRHLAASQPWHVPFAGEVTLEFAFVAPDAPETWQVYLAFFSSAGTEVAASQSVSFTRAHAAGRSRLRCELKNFRLTPGTYTVSVGLRAGTLMEDFLQEIVHIEVVPTPESLARQAATFRGAYVPEIICSTA
jgi:hypothetical protein